MINYYKNLNEEYERQIRTLRNRQEQLMEELHVKTRTNRELYFQNHQLQHDFRVLDRQFDLLENYSLQLEQRMTSLIEQLRVRRNLSAEFDVAAEEEAWQAIVAQLFEDSDSETESEDLLG